jgi:hypothetical protein
MNLSFVRADDPVCDITWTPFPADPGHGQSTAYGEVIDSGTDYVTVQTLAQNSNGNYYIVIETDADDLCRSVTSTDNPTPSKFSNPCNTSRSSTITTWHDDDPVNVLQAQDDSPFTITFYFAPIEGCEPPGGGLIRPFSVEDENLTWGIFDNSDLVDYLPQWTDFLTFSDPDLVYAIAQNSDAYVMAAGDATVTNIVPFYPGECGGLGLISDICLVALPSSGVIDFDLPWKLYKASSTADLWQVTITLDDSGDQLIYIVRSAHQYVHMGLHISGGCILGKAIPLEGGDDVLNVVKAACVPCAVFLDLFELTGDGPDPDVQGLAWVAKIDPEAIIGYAPLAADLTAYASPDQACNIDPRFTDCMVSDPSLKDPDQWETDGPAEWFTTGVGLDPGGSVYQQINLEDSTSYHMIISLVPDPLILLGNSTGEVSLYLGDQSQSFTVSPGDDGQYEMIVTPAPDYGGQFYTVRVTNTGSVWLNITGICIGEDGAQLVPSDCLVQNPSFDYDLSSWTASSGVEWSYGKAWVPSGDTLTQEITLPPGDYQISIEVFVWTNPGWDGTGDISLDVTWPGEMTPDTIATDPTWNLPGHLGFPATPETLTNTITIGSDTTGDLILEPGSSENEDILGLKIDRVCISEQGTDGRFHSTCDVVPEPADNTIGPWISYHWQQLNRFFQCDLMVFLNKQLRIIQAFFKTSTYTMRYFIAFVQKGGDWSKLYFFPWINGHFRNMAVGQVTTVTQSGGANFWDVLIALINGVVAPIISSVTQVISLLTALIGQAAGLLFTLITGIITLFLQLINSILALLQLGQQLLASLITAYNDATPTAIPGAPDCSNPQSGPFCMAIWVLDNTIFSGPGIAIIPIMVGILSIHLILWVVSDLKKTAINFGQAS